VFKLTTVKKYQNKETFRHWSVAKRSKCWFGAWHLTTVSMLTSFSTETQSKPWASRIPRHPSKYDTQSHSSIYCMYYSDLPAWGGTRIL